MPENTKPTLHDTLINHLLSIRTSTEVFDKDFLDAEILDADVDADDFDEDEMYVTFAVNDEAANTIIKNITKFSIDIIETMRDDSMYVLAIWVPIPTSK